MLGLSQVGIPSSTYEAARQQGFIDKARQDEEKRGDNDTFKSLATDKFPVRDGVDLLSKNFGKDYADGYRHGVYQASQPFKSSEEQKTPEGQPDGQPYALTVGEAFRKNIIVAVDKQCKVLRRQIEKSMTEGMAEFAMKRATEKIARIYGYDLVFNFNAPPKTRRDIDRKIEAEANELSKSLRKTRKWNSYPSDAVQETIRQIKSRIIDTDISEYIKEKIAAAKKSAENAVYLSEEKIIQSAIQAAKNVVNFCREWKEEVSRWKDKFGDEMPPGEEFFVENHEHMADEVMKRYSIMNTLFPGFKDDEKLKEHEKWADAIALADPYADNQSDYTPIRFLRGWTAAGIKLLLMSMQRQINKIKRAFEQTVIVEEQFVDAEEEAREAEREKARLQKLREDNAREARRVRAEKLKVERALAAAKKQKEEEELAEQQRLRISAMKKQEEERKRLQELRNAAEVAGNDAIIQAVEQAQEEARKQTLPQTIANIPEERKENADLDEEGEKEEEKQESLEALEEKKEELQTDLQQLASIAEKVQEEIDTAPSAESIRAANALINLVQPNTGAQTGAEILSAMAEESAEDAAATAMLGLQAAETSDESDFEGEFKKAMETPESSEASAIIFEDALDAAEALWAAMKLKDSLFASTKERMDYVDALLNDDGTAKEIMDLGIVNKQLIEELERLYDITKRKRPARLAQWKQVQNSDLLSMLQSSEIVNESVVDKSSEEDEMSEDEPAEEDWLESRKKTWRKFWKTDRGRKFVVRRRKTVKEMKARLKKLNMPVSGKKADLEKRLEFAEKVYQIAMKKYLLVEDKDNTYRSHLRKMTEEELGQKIDKKVFNRIAEVAVNDAEAASAAVAVAEVVPEATAWTHEHYKTHKQHFVNTMFRKAAALMSRFTPKSMRFAPKPASIKVAVAVPVAVPVAIPVGSAVPKPGLNVQQKKKFAAMNIHLNADAPLPVQDIMSRE